MTPDHMATIRKTLGKAIAEAVHSGNDVVKFELTLKEAVRLGTIASLARQNSN